MVSVYSLYIYGIEIIRAMQNQNSLCQKLSSAWVNLLLFLIATLSFSMSVSAQQPYFTITEQGSFAVGGTVISNPGTSIQFHGQRSVQSHRQATLQSAL
jgi:hypothetical protein